MRLSIAHNTPVAVATAAVTPEPATPDLSYLKNDFSGALRSFLRPSSESRRTTLLPPRDYRAMKEVPQSNAFILDRPREHYLHYGWNRHSCLGQHVSPVIIVESVIALLGLENLSRPEPAAAESSFPFERRFGRLQLDDQNLYATTFTLRFADTGTTRQFWPALSGRVESKGQP
jgi:hypothetical protein